jgi:putative membrane protein
MKNIISIFVNDIKRILKRPIGFSILIGLIFLPGLYAWIYIKCTWNPYDNVGNLPIAIVNKDKGAKILDSSLNMGNSLVNSLKENNSMKWLFISDADAEEKVKSSDVYGKIIFPEDFSKKLISIFDTGEIRKPELDFTINHKKNAVTPIIVNKAVSTIKDTINQNIINKLIYKVLDTAENMDILNKIKESTDKIISELENGKEGISNLKSIFDMLERTADNTNSSLSNLRDTLPTINSLTGTTKDGISDLQGTMNTVKDLSNDIDNTITSLEDESNEMAELIDFDPQRENMEIISNKIDTIDSNLTNEKNKIQRVQNFLSTISQHVQLNAINSLQKQFDRIINEIDNTQTIISNNRKTKKDIDSINKKLKNIHSQKIGVYQAYRKDIKSNLDNAIYYSSNSMNVMTNLLTGVNDVAQKSDTALASVMKALDNTKELTDNLKHIGDKLQKEVDNIIESLEDSKKNDLYDKLSNIMKNNPEDVADFLSTPVKTKEISVFGTDAKGEALSYGSKLCPFYTILACWVGGISLITVVKTEVTDMEGVEKFKNYEKFLGRFMIYGILALFQGLVIGLGDLILKVQVLHTVAFLITIMTSSLVFVFFIYTMAVSFGRVGHAISLLALVVQVAGSGGTFPVELLPRAYEILQPIMPLYPGMNALRETIGGFYGNDYAKYILMLLAHTILPLLLGLIFRNPIINLKQKFNRQLEKSHLIAIVYIKKKKKKYTYINYIIYI